MDGDGRFVNSNYTGCFLTRLPQYLVAVSAKSSHAAASYDSARAMVVKAPNVMVRAMLTVGLAVLAGSTKQLETKSEENDATTN